MTKLDIAPRYLRTLHAVLQSRGEDIEELKQSIGENGWLGRRLLVEEVAGPNRPTQYYAWTGCHRTEAALKAGLCTVPCLVIGSSEADNAFRSAGYDSHEYGGIWRNTIVGVKGPGDRNKLAALEEVGLTEAAELMRDEIEANKRQE